MFDLVYRQNLPRTPAYLGMSLSVRGRKLFKAKKSKKPEEQNKKSKKEKSEIIKNADILPKYVKTMLSPKVYTGPIIHDFIEELQSYYDSSDNGIDFAFPVNPPVKKKHSGTKNERVHKKININKSKSNKSFIDRNVSVKENNLAAPIVPKNRLIKNDYLRLFDEWSAKTNEEKLITKTNGHWERDTSSILKGKTILAKLNNETCESNLNKSDSIQRCSSSLSLTIFPSLNNNNNQITRNNKFLTIGLGLKSIKSAVTNQLILPNNCQS